MGNSFIPKRNKSNYESSKHIKDSEEKVRSSTWVAYERLSRSLLLLRMWENAKKKLTYMFYYML